MATGKDYLASFLYFSGIALIIAGIWFFGLIGGAIGGAAGYVLIHKARQLSSDGGVVVVDAKPKYLKTKNVLISLGVVFLIVGILYLIVVG